MKNSKNTANLTTATNFDIKSYLNTCINLRPIVRKGDKVTKEQATTMLNNYVDAVRSKLEKSVPTWNELNMNQQDALISFGYNVGPDFYGKKDFETITKALATVDTLKTVPEALKLYKKSGGKVLNGLVNRRKAEGDLWNSVVR